jgi:hypothetical protein
MEEEGGGEAAGPKGSAAAALTGLRAQEPFDFLALEANERVGQTNRGREAAGAYPGLKRAAADLQQCANILRSEHFDSH